MAHALAFQFSHPLSSLRRSLSRRRAARRLSGSLTRLSENELDGLLARTGRTRRELFADFRGNARHRRLMGHMMTRFGLDPAEAARRRWRELRAAEALCLQCGNKGRCRRWLEWGRENPAPTVFCPNAALFARLRLDLARPDGGEAAGKAGADRVATAWSVLRDLEDVACWRRWQEAARAGLLGGPGDEGAPVNRGRTR